jgi:hypothetical protein
MLVFTRVVTDAQRVVGHVTMPVGSALSPQVAIGRIDGGLG